MQKTIQLLKTLGLDERQARTYLTALEIGPSTIAYLAKKTGVKRTSLYVYIEDMILRGLIKVSISGKRKLYEALDPEALEALIDKQKEAVDLLIPELLLLAHKSPQKPKIRFYEGVEGIKTVFMDRINQIAGSEILYFSHYGESHKLLSDTFLDKYREKRLERNIYTRAIIPLEKYSESSIQTNTKLREMILVPEEDLPITSEVSIYGDKVAILSYDEKVALIMESPQIANTLRAIFNLLWAKLKTDEKPSVSNVVKAPVTIL